MESRENICMIIHDKCGGRVWGDPPGAGLRQRCVRCHVWVGAVLGQGGQPHTDLSFEIGYPWPVPYTIVDYDTLTPNRINPLERQKMTAMWNAMKDSLK